MFPLPTPWKQAATVDPDREYVAFASRFYLKSPLDVPRFMWQSIKIMRQLNGASPGLVGWSMWPDLRRLQFHTFSVWEDAEALRRFNGSGDLPSRSPGSTTR